MTQDEISETPLDLFATMINSKSFRIFHQKILFPKFFGTSPTSVTDELIKNIDVSAEKTSTVLKPHSNSKLNRGLQAEPDIHLSSRNQGALSALEIDIEEVVQSYMSKHGFAIVAGQKPTAGSMASETSASIDSNILEVESVTLTPDGSLITVNWWSPVLENFCDFASQSKSEIEVARVREKATLTIGRKLQMKEGAFRTAIIQKINFKRIPKLTFQPFEGKKKK